eukprot:COSAG01_NODE_61387_length_289_cov_15.063158_1_plen_75_part_01
MVQLIQVKLTGAQSNLTGAPSPRRPPEPSKAQVQAQQQPVTSEFCARPWLRSPRSAPPVSTAYALPCAPAAVALW